MTAMPGPVTSWSRIFVMGAALGLLLLLACLVPAARYFLVSMGGDVVMASITNQSEIATPLVLRVAAFSAAALALHLTLGLGAAGMAWCSERVRPPLARSRKAVTFLWFVALTLWIMVGNAAWYPISRLGDYYAVLGTLHIGPVSLLAGLSLLLAALIAYVAGAALLTVVRTSRWAPRATIPSALVLLLAVSVLFGRDVVRASQSRQPHVIVIGLDSLRLDQLAAFGGTGTTPVLDELLRESRVFSDTITPLARTYPSWMSILTGRHPRTTGASLNLTPRNAVRAAPTIADLLRGQGYHTVYATDETRFANIDQSYGFDQLVTPVIGASDFVLGNVFDVPVVNLATNTFLGGHLFPDTHANRGAASTYYPEEFIERIAAEVRFERPTLLAVHLTASHWPYYWANSPRTSNPGGKRNQQLDLYRTAIALVDSQVSEILEIMRARGVLENALVVFLSDHGEALSLPGDSLVESASEDVARRVTVALHGHGTSVLSAPQFQVLLAFRGYGRSSASILAATSSSPASLEDIAPTLLRLLNVPYAPDAFDGRALPLALPPERADEALTQRVRFTETDFNLPRMLAGDFNVKWMAINGAKYYRVNPRSGWLEFRPEKVAEVFGNKERAAIYGDWLLAALPTVAGNTRYAFVNRKSGTARILERVPDPATEPQAAHLLRALHDRFPGELSAPGAPARAAASHGDQEQPEA